MAVGRLQEANRASWPGTLSLLYSGTQLNIRPPIAAAIVVTPALGRTERRRGTANKWSAFGVPWGGAEAGERKTLRRSKCEGLDEEHCMGEEIG